MKKLYNQIGESRKKWKDIGTLLSAKAELRRIRICEQRKLQHINKKVL